MSDRTRRTAWKGIKKNLQKPFVRKRKNAFQASRQPASMSEDPTRRSMIPVVIGNNAREDVYHESRTEVQTQNTGSDDFDEAFVSPYVNLRYPKERVLVPWYPSVKENPMDHPADFSNSKIDVDGFVHSRESDV
ncbi:uncharacterized protein [Porites lutea]|uniref:uncharacterized protein n=1 Tax=Porites lutea TaxID=51062 RepID=UPI003CC68564